MFSYAKSFGYCNGNSAVKSLLLGYALKKCGIANTQNFAIPHVCFLPIRTDP